MSNESEIDGLVPNVDSDGVYEGVFADRTVLTVALAPHFPMLLQRFPIAGAEQSWLDWTPLEFETLPAFVVGASVILDDARGEFRSAPITWIVKLDGDDE